MISLICITVVITLAVFGGANIHYYLMSLFAPHFSYIKHKPHYYLLKTVLLFVCSGVILYLMIKFNILPGYPTKSTELPIGLP